MDVQDDRAPAEVGRSETRRLVRQSGTTGIAAFGSVVAGLLLSVAIAAAFGAGKHLDAFFVGANIPIGLAAMVMTAANQTLVPKFSTWFVQRSDQDAMASISGVFTATVFAGVVLACLGGLLALPLARLTAPGLSDSSISLAASISRIMFFIVPLTAAAEVLRGLLNSRYAFVAPAAMNIVMNGIAAIIVLSLAGADVHTVAWAYLAGAAGQLVFMWALARRRGFRALRKSPFRDAEVGAVARLSVLPLVAAGLNPLVRVVEQLFASFLPTGSISIVNYGMTLVNAIGGAVFFRSVIVALLPRLTEATARNQRERVAETASLGLKVMLSIALPLTAFMAVLAKPAVRAVFARGSFDKASAGLLGLMLAVYAASLVGSAVQRALLAPFFAKLDTRTPLRNTFYGVLANLVLLPICVLPWGRGHRNAVLGIAIAYSVSQYVNVAHAAFRLRRTLGTPLDVPVQWVLRVAIASGLSAGAMFAAATAVHLDGKGNRLVILAKTAAIGIGGLAVLGMAIAALGAGEARRTLAELRGNRRRRAKPVDGAAAPDSATESPASDSPLVGVPASTVNPPGPPGGADNGGHEEGHGQ